MRSPAGFAPLRRLVALALLAGVGVPVAGCGGGSEAKLEAALHQLERGQLDRVLAILEDASGPRADELRARVEARRAARGRALTALEDYRASRGDRERNELLAELQAMLAAQDDPVVVEWIRQEMSSTADWIAERNAARPRGAGAAPPEAAVAAERDPDPAEVRMSELIQEIERARADRRWSEALASLDRLAADHPAAAGLAASRRGEVLAAAATEAAALVADAERMEREDGLEPAAALLGDARWRFPGTVDEGGAIAAFLAREQDLRTRLAAVRAERAAQASSAAPGAAPGDPADLAAEAHAAEQAGALERAAELWRAVVAATKPGAARRLPEYRAWTLERRLELRRELAATAEVDWAALEPSDVAALVAAHELSDGAAVGGCLERLRPSAHPATEATHEAALDDLARLVDAGAIPEVTAWRVLAEYRHEPLPADGYRYVRGDWLSRAEQEAASLRRRAERLLEDVAQATPARRAELSDELADLAADADPRMLAELLLGRAEAAIERMNAGLTWRKLEEVARARAELDRLRAKVLALVADEDRYFYPYNPPADPRKSYADYVSAQREISAATDAVQKLWEEDPAVELPAGFREAARVLEFVRAQPPEWRAALELPADWPDWFAGVDLTAEVLRLRAFAWTAAERDALRRDEAVLALVAKRWDAAGDAGPDIEERRALELTNDYRRMLGRRALAWDARLFTAAEWHSAYMAETGNFGHEEPDRAGRVTLFDRMESAGYEDGWNENCQAGTEWARRAFDSWRASSEHHRNLVSDIPREVAVARNGTYWTMNFGRGNDFENELDPWRD